MASGVATQLDQRVADDAVDARRRAPASAPSGRRRAPPRTGAGRGRGALADERVGVGRVDGQEAIEGLVRAAVVGGVGRLACVLVVGKAQLQQRLLVGGVGLDGVDGLGDEQRGVGARVRQRGGGRRDRGDRATRRSATVAATAGDAAMAGRRRLEGVPLADAQAASQQPCREDGHGDPSPAGRCRPELLVGHRSCRPCGVRCR